MVVEVLQNDEQSLTLLVKLLDHKQIYKSSFGHLQQSEEDWTHMPADVTEPENYIWDSVVNWRNFYFLFIIQFSVEIWP